MSIYDNLKDGDWISATDEYGITWEWRYLEAWDNPRYKYDDTIQKEESIQFKIIDLGNA